MARDGEQKGKPAEAVELAADTGQVPKVHWDDSRMQSTYANVVNAASTREEVTLFFGTNQTWNIDERRELTVQLAQRIILSPFAAKRLHLLLGTILQQYENRFGTLKLDAANRVPEHVSAARQDDQ